MADGMPLFTLILVKVECLPHGKAGRFEKVKSDMMLSGESVGRAGTPRHDPPYLLMT